MSAQTQLQKIQPVVQTLAKQFEYSEDFVQTVKDTFAKGATDNELKLFLQTAKRTGLDPFARQIYCIKRYDGAAGGMVMGVQISIDGFRLIADRTNCYVPSREPTYTFDEDRNLESATAYIKKLVAGTWHEVSATAFYSEYVQTKKDGEPNSMWKKMPRLMLAKTAESLVLRKAFPAELSGLYTVEEMGTDLTATEQPDPLHPAQKQTVAVAPASPIAQANTDADPLNKSLADLCKKLNDAGDSILWKKASLTEYANSLVDSDAASFTDLPADRKTALVEDLQGRLEDLRVQNEERAAINDLDNEVVDGEVIEAETAQAFADEVF